MCLECLVALTCIFPISPVDSILLATLTVFPQISYCGLLPPTTPATTGPRLSPTRRENTLYSNDYENINNYPRPGMIPCLFAQAKPSIEMQTPQEQQQSVVPAKSEKLKLV